MRKITGKEDLRNPIFFLFLYTLILGGELGHLSKSLESYGSIILTEPILTFANLAWFYFAAFFIYLSFKDKFIIIKFAYFLGGVSFIFTESVINKVGYKSLYAIKIGILFTVTMMLLKHLLNVTGLYQSKLRQKDTEELSDNQLLHETDGIKHRHLV